MLKNAWELTRRHGGGGAPEGDPCAERHTLVGEEQVIKSVGKAGPDQDSLICQVMKQNFGPMENGEPIRSFSR